MFVAHEKQLPERRVKVATVVINVPADSFMD